MEEFSLLYILTVFKRHIKYFFITCALLFALTIIFALHWSNYRSVATVEIERPAISQNVTIPHNGDMEDAIIALADQHVDEVRQIVTSPASLSEIINRFNLYPNLKNSMSMEALTDLMRSKIHLDFISSQISNPIAAQKETAEQLSAVAFVLDFDYTQPDVAQQVTGELVKKFIDEDKKQRHMKAQETSAFLAAQIAELEKSMADQEKKIADFKSKYGETGPAVLMFNEQASANASLDLHNIESQISASERTQGSLRSQLATIDPYSRVIADGQVLTTPATQLKALEAQYATLSGQYGPDYPDVIKVRNEIEVLKKQVGGYGAGDDGARAQLKAQITDVRANLAAAESDGGPDNPDVIALKYKLSGLEKQLAATHVAHGRSDGIKDDADNPAYLSVLAQLRAEEEQYKSLVNQRDMLRAQQAKYQRIIAENPGIEQQMAVLSRDYENAQQRYRELKEKKMAADMSEQLEQEQKGERLVVLNPPSLPTKTQPSRLLIILGGLVFSLVGGIVAVALLEAMNQSVYGAAHLASVIGAAPIVSIPYISIPKEQHHIKRLKTYGALAVVCTSLIIGLLFIVTVPTYYAWNFISHLFKLS